MNPTESEEESLMDKPDNVIPCGTSGDSAECTDQTEVEQHSDGNIAEKPSDETMSLSTLGQTFIATQQDGTEPSQGDQAKSNEMVFTVVAVDGNISGLTFNNGSLPKEVQLSILPTGEGSAEVQFQNSQNSGLFNQLALIASAMPPSTSAQEVQEPLQFVTEKNDQSVEKQPEINASEKGENFAKNEEKYYADEKPVKKERVRCSVCNQDFSDLPSMRRHRLIHSDAKPFQCEFCEKAFRRKDNLREHRNIHTQENVYTCTRCGKTFPRKYTHKVHMAKFCTKEKMSAEASGKNGEWAQPENNEGTSEANPAILKVPSRVSASTNTKCSDPCLICHKTFRDTSTLKRHLLTHSDERPFKCEECNKSFRRKDHLMEHVIVHNEVRPFTCQQCGKSFSRKNGLKTHMIRTSHCLMHDQQPVILSHETTEDLRSGRTSNIEQSTTEKTNSDVELVLAPNQVFLKNIPNNEGQIEHLNETSQNSGTITSDNRQVSQNSGTMTQNSNNLVSNAIEIMESETTVVFSEKSHESSHPNDIAVSRNDSSNFTETNGDPGMANSRKSDEWMSGSYGDGEGGALRCPNCANVFPGKERLWQHFQEHLGDDLFGCEHCFTTFTTPEQVKEHKKACVHAVTSIAGDNENVTVINERGAQSGEVSKTGPDISGDMDEISEAGTSIKRSEEDAITKGVRNCPVCNKNFRDSTALKRHSLVHSGERPHGCDQCGKRFRRRDHLKSHVTAYHLVTTTFQCKACQMTFSTRYCLTTHTKTCKKPSPRGQSATADPAKPAQPVESKCCPICNKAFKDSSSQRRHQRTHSEERPFPCSLCTKSFRRKDNLKEHMLCHSDHKPFSCEDCGKALSRRSSLTNHRTICAMRRVGSSMAVTHNQPQTQALPENLTIQDNVSLPENQPIVETQTLADTQTITESQAIPEESTQPGNQSLPEHQPLAENYSDAYTETSSETLDMCTSGVTQEVASSSMHDSNNGEAIDDIQDMENEEDIGEGEKKFPCNLCGKIFRAKWTLKYHQHVHTGEKPYTCLTCDRQFRQPNHLKIHQRTHSGERPYVCEACGRAFIDSSTMRRHARVHKDAADPNEVIDDSGTTDEVNDVDETEVTMQENIEGVEIDVNSAQPISSTAAVPGINQSDEANIVHVVRELRDDDESCHAQEMAIANKIQSLNEVNWQGNVQDNVEQMTYYIVPANKEGNEKQASFENISF